MGCSFGIHQITTTNFNMSEIQEQVNQVVEDDASLVNETEELSISEVSNEEGQEQEAETTDETLMDGSAAAPTIDSEESENISETKNEVEDSVETVDISSEN